MTRPKNMTPEQHEEQLAKERAWRNAWRAAAAAKGKCVKCAKRKPRAGKATCRICNDQALDYYYEHRDD